MKKRIAWAGAILSLVAIGLLLWRVNLRDLGAAIAGANVGWLLASYAVFFFMFGLRAWRWSGLLGGTPYWVTFHANIIGYMFNILLPLRLGEIARAWIIAKKTDIGMPRALSAVLVERLIDLAAVLFIFAGLTQFVPMPESFRRAALFGSVALVIAIVGTGLVVAKGNLLEPFVKRKFGAKADMPLARFAEIRTAFKAIASPKQIFQCAMLTIGLWGATLLCIQLCMKAFLPAETDFVRAGLVLVAANLSGALPSAPGGLGIVQGFATSALVVPFGIPEGRALAFVLVLSLGQQLVLVLAGLVSMARVGTSFGEIRAGVDQGTSPH